MGPILLVEDNYDHRLMIRSLLENQGYRVISVDGAKDALLALQKHPVSLLITDLYMPGITGLGLLRSMRDIGRPVPPVIVLTGYAFLSDEAGRSAALGLGARMILTKPVGSDELLKAVALAVTTDRSEVKADIDEERQA